MHSGEHGLAVINSALNKCKMLDVVDSVAICDAREAAPLGGDSSRTHALDKLFVVAAIINQVCNG